MSFGFSIAPGTMTALANRDDNRAYYTLEGDLSQMGRMEQVLRGAGFPVVKWDVYPGFTKENEEQYIEALRYIFQNRIEGWWNQERKLIQYEICTQEQFDRALGRPILSDMLARAEAVINDYSLRWTPEYGAWVKVRAMLLFRRGRCGELYKRIFDEIEEVLGREVRFAVGGLSCKRSE